VNAAPLCAARSKLAVPGKPDSFFICTQHEGHRKAHTACDGRGRILARWHTLTSPLEVWVLGHHFTV